MLFLSSMAFILMWFDISIFIFLKFILGGFKSKGVINDTSYNTVSLESYIGYLYSRQSPAGKEGFIINQGYSIDGSHNGATQYFITYDDDIRVTRTYNWDSASWTSWKTFSLDFPSFYKDYTSLTALATGLGSQSVEFLKFISSTSEWDGHNSYTFSDIPATTLIFWKNQTMTNGCGLLLKDGNSIVEIAKSGNVFNVTCDSTSTLTFSSTTVAGGAIKLYCIRP